MTKSRGKVIVCHHYWDRVGGGERVDALVVKTLLEHGYEVSIVATTGFNWENYRSWFNLDLGGIRIYTLLPRLLPAFGVYQRALTWLPLMRAILKENPDIVWIDTDFYTLPYRLFKSSMRWINYIHFPTPEYKRELEYIEKYSKGLWKPYFEGFMLMSRLFAYKKPLGNVICCNSAYIQRLCQRQYGVKPVVLHPPVGVKQFLNPKETGRENSIVMIGRVSPEKRYEEAIEALFHTKTKPMLHIIGGLTPAKIGYYRFLQKTIKNFDLEKKVSVYIDLPLNEMLKLVKHARILLHTTHQEHFGISICEGMAAGCVPIVHKSGGPYQDIIDYGKYGLTYQTVDELAKTIDKIILNPSLWRRYHRLAYNRAKEFDESKFRQNIINLFDSIQKISSD